MSEDNHNGLSSQDMMLLWWAYDLYFGQQKADKTPAKGKLDGADGKAPEQRPPKAQSPAVTPPEGGSNR